MSGYITRWIHRPYFVSVCVCEINKMQSKVTFLKAFNPYLLTVRLRVQTIDNPGPVSFGQRHRGMFKVTETYLCIAAEPHLPPCGLRFQDPVQNESRAGLRRV